MNIDETPNDVTVEGGATSPGIGLLARAYARGVHLGLHIHREAQLVYAARGVIQVTTPKGRWLVPPERAVWVPPRLEHAIDVLVGIDMRTLYVEPKKLAAHPMAAQLADEFVVQVTPLLREVIAALFRPDADRTQLDLLSSLALFQLERADSPSTFIPMPSDPRARQVAELVLANPARMPNLAALASAVGTSARTLTRLFPAETHFSFKQWCQRARIMAALEQLGRGDRSIKEVAFALGFSSTAAFGFAFRQVMGVTPSEFLEGR